MILVKNIHISFAFQIFLYVHAVGNQILFHKTAYYAENQHGKVEFTKVLTMLASHFLG